MPFWHLKKSIMVGLSIHQDEIRLLRLRIGKQQYLVEDYAIVPCTQDSQLPELVKRIVKKTKSEHCYAATALPFTKVINKQIKMANYLNRTECKAEIVSNKHLYLSGGQQNVIVDCAPLIDEHPTNMLLVAAPIEQVSEYILMMKQAKLNIKVIDIDQFALTRAVLLASQKQDEVVIVIDLDVAHSHLLICQNKKILFSHQLTMNQEFKQQLKQALTFLASSHQSLDIRKIFLSGKLSLLSAIKNMIQSDLVYEIETLNPFSFMTLSPSVNESEFYQFAPSLLLACGLALRGPETW